MYILVITTMSYVCLCFFFFKQKTAYEMRISDWSSDVCSSDLRHPARIHRDNLAVEVREPALIPRDQLRIERPRTVARDIQRHLRTTRQHRLIGRASCRERVCQYV